MAINETISVEVAGLGEVNALATGLDKAAESAARLQGAVKGLDFSAAGGGGLDKLGASWDAQAAKMKADIAEINASMAKIGDVGAAAGGGAEKLAGQWDAAAGNISGSVDKITGSMGKLAGGGIGDAAAGPGKLVAAWDAAAAQISVDAKAIADAQMEAVGAAGAQGDARTSLAADSVAADTAMIESSKAQSAAAKKAAADAEASASKHQVAFLGIAAAAGYGTYMAAQLQTQVTRLYTSAGESQKNLPMMSSGILALSGQTATSQAQLAQGAYYAESAGFHGQNALAVTRTAAQGAKAEGSDVGTVSNALTTVLNDYFGGSAGKSPGQMQTSSNQAMNAIITAVGQGKMTLQDLATAAPVVLPTAKNAGLNIGQTLGAVSQMTSRGESAQDASQQVRHAITALQKPNNVQAAEMQLLGINPNQLSQDLGKQGLTGTIAEVDKAIQSHTKNGMVNVSTMNQAALATQSANQEIAALPKNLQSTAKGYLAGTTSQAQWYALTSQSKSPLSAQDVNLLKQFATTANTAKGFSSLEKSGLGDKQTTAAALNAMMGGQVGQQVAQLLGGKYLPDFTSKVNAVNQSVQHTGQNIKGWSDIQDTLNFKIQSFKNSAEAAATSVGQVLLPAASKALSGLSGAAGFFASNPAVAKVALGGAGVLGAGYAATKVASVGSTALQGIGKIAETLHIPGLDKLTNIGASTGLGGAATSLTSAGGELSAAAGELSGAAGKLDTTGGLGGGAGRAAGAAESGAASAAEGAGAGGVLSKVKNLGLPGIGAYAGPIAAGLAAGLGLRGFSDSQAPAGTPLGALSKKTQQVENNSAMSYETSGLQAKIAGGGIGQSIGGIVDSIGSAISHAINISTPKAAPGSGYTSIASPFGAAVVPNRPAPAPAPQPQVSAQFTNTLAQAMGKPVKLPAPDLSALSAAKGTAQADATAISTAMAQALTKPAKAATPDLSAYKSAVGTARSDGSAVSAGFAQGILGGEGAAVAAAGQVAAAAASAMNQQLQVHSPSKVTEKTGAATSAGLASGITSGTAAVKNASTSIGSSSITSIIQGLQGGQTNLQNAQQAIAGQLSNPDAVTQIQQTILGLQQAIPASNKALLGQLAEYQTKLTGLANKQGAIEAQINYAQQTATSQIGNASILNSAQYQPALQASNGGFGGPQSAVTTITGLGYQAKDQTAYAQQLQQLQKMGLNSTSLSQLTQAGASAGLPIAQGLTQGGKAAVGQVNTLEAQIVGASKQIGNVAGPAMYQAGVQAGQGLAAGLKSALAGVDAAMTKMASQIVAIVKKDLKISSPSQLMADEVGAMIPAGVGIGIDRGTPAAVAAMGRMGARLATPPAGFAAASSGPGGGGGDTHYHSYNVTVQGSVMSNQSLFAAMQEASLQAGSNNWQTGLIFPGRHS